MTDEVNANNMVIEMSIEVNIKELQTACEEINKRYGLDVSVDAKGVAEYLPDLSTSPAKYDNPEGDD